MHEPGPQRAFCCAKTYADAGFEQGRAVLQDLAVHPSTANHIATKLVRYFVADDPPPSLVTRLANRFTATGGDLKAVTEELIKAPRILSAPREKLKKPSEWIVAALREIAARACRTCAGSCKCNICSASRCGTPRRRRDSPTTARPGSTASRSS